MSIFKKNIFPLLVFLATVLCCACNSGVDRNKASKLINEAYGFPKIIEWDLISGTVNVSQFDYNGDQGEKLLVQNGYRKNDIAGQFEDRSGSILDWNKMSVNYQLTDKAKSLELNVVSYSGVEDHILEIGKFELGTINSLRKINDNEYEVEFSVIVNLNELGNLVYGINYGFMNNLRIKGSTVKTKYQYYLSKGGESLKQRIVKYDDGWRVSTEDITSFRKKIEPQLENN
ncbi:MAG: hypothetical protein ABI402_05915 [Ferruginibacter sp.]